MGIVDNTVSVSQSELVQRRKNLRHQRRVRFLQASWRAVAVVGLAGGLVWAVTQPTWVINESKQVKIEGNQFIPVQTIRSLLPIDYPQSLWRLEPRKIAAELQSRMPLADVTVTRQLFPPALIVQLRERSPVAIGISATANAQTLDRKDLKSQNLSGMGLLDENGNWISLERYTSLDQSLKLPSLKVLGNYEQYSSYWAKLYQDIRKSPVKISEIDCRNPTNVILKTELGAIHIGSYSDQFSYQLATLSKMWKLPNRLSSSEIAYIDLRNPNAPTVQVSRSKDPAKLDLP